MALSVWLWIVGALLVRGGNSVLPVLMPTAVGLPPAWLSAGSRLVRRESPEDGWVGELLVELEMPDAGEVASPSNEDRKQRLGGGVDGEAACFQHLVECRGRFVSASTPAGGACSGSATGRIGHLAGLLQL